MPVCECAFNIRVGCLVLLVYGGDVNTSKQVTIHTVGPSDVVKLGSVVKELAGVLRDEVSVHHWGQFQHVHHRIWKQRLGRSA